MTASDRAARRRPRPSIATIAVTLAWCLVVAACRPPLAGESDGTAVPNGGTPGPSATPAPAIALKPRNETSVSVRLFRGFGPADAPLQYAQALDSYRDSNLVVDITPPIAGYDPFQVEAAPDSLALWVGTVADVAPAAAAGLDLVAVGESTGRDPTVLVVPAKQAGESLTKLKAATVLADTAGSAASLRAALAAAGLAEGDVKIVTPDDPSGPFDPTSLLDGTAAAAAVSGYDGWARIQEAVVLNGGDPAQYVQEPVRPSDEALLGELIWAQAKDVADPALAPAITGFLAVVAQSQVACRDAVEDCAANVASQSDRTPEGIAWSIDQLDRLLYPAPDGILHVDPAAWDLTLAAMKAAGVAGTDTLTSTNSLVDTVLASLGTTLDVTGADFVPRDDLPLFPSPDPAESEAPAEEPSAEPSTPEAGRRSAEQTPRT
jgi:NitT/TauT family transport system substrate-binding protein